MLRVMMSSGNYYITIFRVEICIKSIKDIFDHNPVLNSKIKIPNVFSRFNCVYNDVVRAL